MEVTIIRKVELSMDEQKKYEVIKSLADHPPPNKERAALREYPKVCVNLQTDVR